MNVLRTIPSSTYKIFAIVAAHLSLVIFNMLFLWYVVSINKDDAQIVNESGIIRGSIQKIVKQELGSINSDDDIKRVDTILLKYIFLRSEELKSAHFGDFITSAQLVDRTFGLLKQRIQLFRSEPNEQNKNELLRISQILWDQANAMVYTAQSASESNIAKAKLFMIVFVLDLLLLATIVKLVYAFANEQLAKQRDLFAKSLDSENTSVFFWDARKNAYYVSDSMKELLGIAHREYIGFEDWLSIVHPEDRDRLSSSIHEAQKSKRPFWSMQYRILDKDGATKEIMSRGFFSYSPEGNIVELPGVHFDVTEKNKLHSLENAKDALETVNAELHYFYNMMDEYIITTHTDLNGIITYASKKFLEVYGFDSADELVGKAHSVIAGENIDKDTYGQLWKTIINGNTWHGEFCNRKKNGDPIWVEAIIAPKRDVSGRIIGYQSVQFYVSDKKMLEQASITDTLTGLKNRMFADTEFTRLMAEAKRFKEKFCVVMVDIDFFKSVNDTYGHQTGDVVLKQIASILKHHTRKSDTVARWGGEEFLLLLSGTSLKNGIAISQKIRLAIEEATFESVGKMSCSFGVSEYKETDSADDVIKRADAALYMSKRTGRNKVSTSD